MLFFLLLLLLFSFSRQASPVPWTSGCGVQRYFHGTLRREPTHGWVDGVLVLPPWHSQVRAVPQTSGCGVQHFFHGTLRREWMWCSALFPWHSQARANPWMSGWGVSVTPMALSSESCPMDEWMWCSALFPWHSQARANPWMSGWGVSVTPMALSSESCPMDEWMWCSALFPWHSQARANPWMSGWGVSVTLMALSSESCPSRMSGCAVLCYSHCTLQRELWLSCFWCPSPFHLGSPPHGVTSEPSRVLCFGALKRELPHGWVDVLFSVIPIAPSSESCDFVVIVVPPPFLWDLSTC